MKIILLKLINIVSAGRKSLGFFKNIWINMWKYSGLYLLVNGCYNYGLYKGETLVDLQESQLIVLTKLQSLWYYLFEIEYYKIFSVIINNIGCFLRLPKNIVFYGLIFLGIFMIYYIICLILRIYVNRLAFKAKNINNENKQFIENILKNNMGTTKTIYDYNKENYNLLVNKYIELNKEYEKLKNSKKDI